MTLELNLTDPELAVPSPNASEKDSWPPAGHSTETTLPNMGK
jgi:hypothetical protein